MPIIHESEIVGYIRPEDGSGNWEEVFCPDCADVEDLKSIPLTADIREDLVFVCDNCLKRII